MPQVPSEKSHSNIDTCFSWGLIPLTVAKNPNKDVIKSRNKKVGLIKR